MNQKNCQKRFAPIILIDEILLSAVFTVHNGRFSSKIANFDQKIRDFFL